MSPVFATVAGSVVVALITGLFVWLGRQADAKATREVAAAQRRLEERKVDVQVFRDSLTELRNRLDEVDEALRHERDQRRMSNGYARTLADVLRNNGMPVPPPPDGLDLL